MTDMGISESIYNNNGRHDIGSVNLNSRVTPMYNRKFPATTEYTRNIYDLPVSLT